MKTKQSFVTNSSSTSYILHTEISGKIIPKQTEDDLTELFKNITNSFPFNNDDNDDNDLELTCEIADFSGHNYVAAKIKENDEYRDFSSDINLRYGAYYDEDKDEDKEVIYIQINSDYRTTDPSNESSFLEDVLIDLLERIVMYSSNRRNKFVYVKTPTDMDSGGWDGGDPMGFYKETMECLRNELEIGTISIKSGSKTIIKRKSLIKK